MGNVPSFRASLTSPDSLILILILIDLPVSSERKTHAVYINICHYIDQKKIPEAGSETAVAAIGLFFCPYTPEQGQECLQG